MKRFTLTDLVQLPRLDAASAVALVRTLLTLADDKKKLPPGVAQAKKRLGVVHKEVAEALTKRLSVGLIDPQRARLADRGEDLAFSALFDFLTGWSKLPAPSKQSAIAHHLLTALFPAGLRFTLLGFQQEWAECQARLDRIDREGLAAQLKLLGGEPFLDNLRAAHKEYGEALGVTLARTDAAPPTAVVKEPLVRLQDALRKYVLQVIAQVEESDATSAQLAKDLLAPLSEWQSRGAKLTAPAEPAPAPLATEPAPSPS